MVKTFDLSAPSSCRFLTLALNMKKATAAILSELRARFSEHRTLEGAEASQIMSRIVSEFSGERRPYFELYLDALIGELLVLLLRVDSAPPTRQVRSADCLPEIVNYIDCNYLSICSLEELSRFGYSYHYICAQFKRTYGITPGAYLLSKRMDYAVHLLSEGQSVSAVATALGYSSPYNFSRAFKKQTGKAPSQYKK